MSSLLCYEQHSDYLERIGIDSTMKRVLVGDSIQYEFTVKGPVDGKEGIQTLVFVTKEVLCDFKVDNGTGRATRVWLVYDKDGGESIEPVLKDVWLEHGTVVEGDSHTHLANLVKVDERQHSVPVKQWYRDHFLHMHTDAYPRETRTECARCTRQTQLHSPSPRLQTTH
ncbi:hypothetical protein E1B28_007294 [Marasmius oreades]|uniref:Uncharacterized protein n=1 Tax=Marasmius oreades TaxID=181124 RepID=A0A9P7S1K7_9AGAR|nr:uncharacterized protein E1B28_007294 [Marasmius oreades]KAG7093630.1 hypothetical protein E1B28_007294 [Marasmius oreades]